MIIAEMRNAVNEAIEIERQQYAPEPEPETQWPVMDERAYQGLVGDIVKRIDPHTESDPVAILGHSLLMFGNMIGRSAHFQVEADRHFTNENAVFVGDTAKGRKGTGEGVALSLFSLDSLYSQEWKADKIKTGLSSGEGIIYHVRDTTDDDEGVRDKRLFIREPEFGGVLRVIERNGNTLSALIRQAWDSGNLQLLTKNNPIKASDAHISINGHITMQELKKYLYEVEIFNGLANRFLWFCVRRSKLLPEGGRFFEMDVSDLKKRISDAIDFSRKLGPIKRDDAARKIWIEVYPTLSEGKPGMLGAVLSRAEAHVMRLALLYALMGFSTAIKADHLLAALAVWEYVEKSAQYIFGDNIGDSVVDRIFAAVCDAPEGITRTNIMALFSNHEKRDRIEDAIKILIRCNKVEIARTNTSGRPVETIKRIRAQAKKANNAK